MTPRTVTAILATALLFPAASVIALSRAPSAPVVIEAPRASVRPAAACGRVCQADPLPLASGWTLHDGVATGGMVLRARVWVRT